MTGFDTVFKYLKLDSKEYHWEGEIPFAFWGGQNLFTYMVRPHDSHQPTEKQRRTLVALYAQQKDIRRPLEKVLFKHYQEDIYRSVSECGRDDEWEELTPTIHNSHEIWGLLCGPIISVPDLDDSPDIEFRIGFDCRWDEEHGFGIETRNWKVVGFGGEAG